MMWKRIAAAILSASMVVSMTACGGSGSSASSDTSYTMWVYSGADASYYTEYEENPSLAYALTKTYGPENKSLSFDFWTPPSGSETDNYQTMIASGDYPDVLSGVISESPKSMLENGIIIDLTDYIKKYMPNYLAYLEANPEVKANAVDLIDGEEHYLGIRGGNDALPYFSFGYEYRRDWIVKYGTNPDTGAAFTGGYSDPEDPDSWTDDVVFPSGGTDPKYISDWEWMFDIFTKAQADLGITDSYSVSMYYPGFTWSGGLCSSFGGGVPVWYVDENNKVQFGGDSDQMRAYLECLNTWYSKGWLDSDFYQRTSDIFYAIDDTSVRQGKVGMWYGVQGQLGGRMDVGDDLTTGICVYGAAYPINDIYGTDDCKNRNPDCVFTTSLTGTLYYVTTAAKEKDIASLLSFFDYFYTKEGALLLSLGLNADQVAEVDSTLYKDWGLEGGAYTVAADGTYVLSDVLKNDAGRLRDACRLGQVPGLSLVENVDLGYTDSYKHSLDTWIQYPNQGFFQGTTVTNNMTDEDAKTADELRTKIIDYMTLKAPEMIRGTTNPFDDNDWATWSKTIQKYNYQKATDLYQPYADTYSFK